MKNKGVTLIALAVTIVVMLILALQGAVRHIEQLIAGHISAHVNPVIIRSREGSMHHKFNSGVQIEVHPFISVSHSASMSLIFAL